jgi:hypothetical protein
MSVPLFELKQAALQSSKDENVFESERLGFFIISNYVQN